MKFTDAELVMYAEGSLGEAREKMLLEAARHNKVLAANLEALDASQLPYRAAYDQQTLPKIPAALRSQIDDLTAVATSSQYASQLSTAPLPGQIASSGLKNGTMNWMQGLATAACVGLCVVFGYWLGDADPSSTQLESASQASTNSEKDTQSAWVERVADYQSLYVANTVKDIVPNRENAEVLLESISERTGMRMEIPDLSESGYQFTRAQELGFMGEPLIQLVYRKPGSAPLALCFMPSGESSDAELEVEKYHGLGTANWIDSGQRFVLVGSEDDAELRKLYTKVHGVFL